MKFKRHIKMERGSLTTIDIAPLVDIIFLLIIFFMLTSSFVFQPGIKVNLPKAITSEVLGQENIIVTVTGENLIYYKGKAVGIDCGRYISWFPSATKEAIEACK